MTDVSTWAMKVDQDIVPSWFNADMEKNKEIIVDAVRIWAQKHIFRDGKHEKSEGIYYLFENARATLWGNAQATLWNDAKATLIGNTKATLFDNAKATMWGNAKATLFDNAKATLRDNAQATLWDNASIGNCKIFDNAIVISHKARNVYVSNKWNMEVI